MDSFAQLPAEQGMVVKADAVGCFVVFERPEMLGTSHSDTIIGMYTLGNINFKRQRYGEAVALYENAYVGTWKQRGNGHADTRESFAGLKVAREAVCASSSWVQGFWNLLP
jgi:hypothetical protein